MDLRSLRYVVGLARQLSFTKRPTNWAYRNLHCREASNRLSGARLPGYSTETVAAFT
jgi:hypothetical protein